MGGFGSIRILSVTWTALLLRFWVVLSLFEGFDGLVHFRVPLVYELLVNGVSRIRNLFTCCGVSVYSFGEAGVVLGLESYV